jgi:hypothetical protein
MKRLQSRMINNPVVRYATVAVVLFNVFPKYGIAQNQQPHQVTQSGRHVLEGQSQGAQPGALVRAVRQATERFKNVAVAESEGYVLHFGCVSGSEYGSMGLHYVNPTFLASGVLDVTRPQVLLYEPLPGGGKRLIGADYLVFADAWNAAHSSPPQIMGQLLHLFEAPNRFRLPAFYTLHVWAWKDNPNGAFVNWHPNVSCEPFEGGHQM